VAANTNRAWNDANRNFVPDCDLLNLAANGECGAGNPNFGRAVFATTYDPEVLNGWNVREYSWDLSAGVQHEIVRGMSALVSYVRRSWGNQVVTDNRAYSLADYDVFGLTAPRHGSLPDGGGYRVNGLYELKPTVPFGRVDNFVTHAKNYGDYRETYNGVDLTVNTRLTNGLHLQGGFSTGRSALDQCEVMAQVPEALTAAVPPFIRTPLDFCDQQTPFLTQYKGLATYTIPRIDVQVAGTFQSRPYVGTNFPSIASQSLAGNWLVTNAQVSPELGRVLSGNAATTFVNIVEPGSLYGERINQIDLRAGKIVRYGRARANVAVDLFNIFNGSAVTTFNQTFSGAGANWLQPTSILSARIAKLSVQFDW
jgi:hypothetical protein